MEKWWNEICRRGKREKPREKPTQTAFRPPRNPHGVTVTRTRDPSGGRRAPNRLRHEAADIGIISVKAYSLHCDSGSNLTLFKYIRYIQNAMKMTSSIWLHIFIYH